LKLLDPPPEKGSAAFNLDQEMAAKYLSVEEGRQEQAALIRLAIRPLVGPGPLY